MAPGNDFFPVPHFAVELRPDATLDQVLGVVKELYGRAGCDNCGRLSFQIAALDDDLILPKVAEIGRLDAVSKVSVQNLVAPVQVAARLG